MRTIAHLSDLHFGRHDAALVEGLLDSLHAAAPDLIAVSGDLTQRARNHEFAAARAFLDELPVPAVVVPGNHDVPLYDVARRFLRPLGRFRRYISPEMEPWFCDEEIAMLGLSTARSATLSSGRISRRQTEAMRAFFARTPAEACRILLMHHPLLPPPGMPRGGIVGRAAPALVAIAEAGVRIVLAGHHHRSFVGDAALRHPVAGRAVLTVQAGTAISTRRRVEPNSFNLLRVERDRVTCTPQLWQGSRFVAAAPTTHVLRDGCWQAAASAL